MSGMKYTTLDQLAPIVERSEGDTLVVIAPAKDSVSVWLPDHPGGWSEDCPRVFRAPAGMNGETREFLRDELNARDGWAITGDNPEESFLDAMDFATQPDMFDPAILAPPPGHDGEQESFPHELWRMLVIYGPQTVRHMEQLIEYDLKKVKSGLNWLKVKGYATIEVHNHRGTYTAAGEPPYYARGTLGQRRRNEILKMLEKGPMSARDIAAKIELPKDQTQPLLGEMRRDGLLKHVGKYCANNVKWRLA